VMALRDSIAALRDILNDPAGEASRDG